MVVIIVMVVMVVMVVIAVMVVPTPRTGLLERMPVMSTKASSTVENVELQNGEGNNEQESAPQINVQVCQ